MLFHEYISKLQSTRCNVSWFIYFYRCSLTNIFPSYNQQDAIFLDLFISTDALSRIYFPIYIQQDATFLDLFISTDALHENISKLQSTRCNVSWFIYFYRCSFTNIFPSYNQQDAMFLDLFISTDARRMGICRNKYIKKRCILLVVTWKSIYYLSSL